MEVMLTTFFKKMPPALLFIRLVFWGKALTDRKKKNPVC